MINKITFREHGQGQPLLLLHGYGGSVTHWEPISENLKDRYRVIVPNLSHVYLNFEKLNFENQVDLIAEFIKKNFANQKVSIAGISYGGAMTWALSLKYPELIEKMILINPMLPDPVKSFLLPEMRYFFVIPLNAKSIYLLLATPIGKSFLKRAAQVFRDERSSGNGQVDNLKGRKLQFVANMIHHFAWILRTAQWSQWQNRMKLARVDSMLIYDKEDLLLAPTEYKEFALEINCEKIIELTGAGHIAIKKRPESIAKFISDFISNVSIKNKTA